jgi:hypothetical protein
MSRLNSGNVCYTSVHSILSFWFLFKRQKFIQYKLIVLRVRCEFLMTVTVKAAVFWNATQYSFLEICHMFRETCCLKRRVIYS